MQLYLRLFYNLLRQQNRTILNGQLNTKHDLKKSKFFSQVSVQHYYNTKTEQIELISFQQTLDYSHKLNLDSLLL